MNTQVLSSGRFVSCFQVVSAPANVVRSNFAPVRLALRNMALVKLALSRLAPVKSAPARRAPRNTAFVNSTLVPITFSKWTFV
jgi:hypothetical protein